MPPSSVDVLKAGSLYLHRDPTASHYLKRSINWPSVFARTLWKQMQKGRFRFIASVLLQQEIEGAPARVRRLMERTFTQEASILPISSEAVPLAAAYLENKVVPAALGAEGLGIAREDKRINQEPRNPGDRK